MLPNMSIAAVRSDPEWTFSMRPKQSYWQFRSDRGVLGFDPAERMLYLGRTQAQEDVWLVLTPEEALQEHYQADPSTFDKTKKPRMSSVAVRIMYAFLNSVFAKIHYSNFTHSYPDVGSEAAMRLKTDIM